MPGQPPKPDIRIKRAYEAATPRDGCRVLIDRVWPRGISRQQLDIVSWMKETAPSSALRKWYDHDPKKWEAFKERYFRELREQPDLIEQIRDLGSKGTVTLVFAARDTEHSNAAALREFLLSGHEAS